MKLVIDANSWREVWAFTKVYAAVWLSYAMSFWPGVAEQRAAAEAAALEQAKSLFDELEDVLADADTHVYRRSDGSLDIKRLSDGITEQQEIAIDAMANRWREEAIEVLGDCDLRVSIGFGEREETGTA
jgi:hypothetical protein